MEITLNGQNKTIQGAVDLQTLIQKFCKGTQNVIVEVNGTVVRSPQWPQRILQHGDRVELVKLVGGG